VNPYPRGRSLPRSRPAPVVRLIPADGLKTVYLDRAYHVVCLANARYAREFGVAPRFVVEFVDNDVVFIYDNEVDTHHTIPVELFDDPEALVSRLLNVQTRRAPCNGESV
jgi:hypothetical protein